LQREKEGARRRSHTRIFFDRYTTFSPKCTRRQKPRNECRPHGTIRTKRRGQVCDSSGRGSRGSPEREKAKKHEQKKSKIRLPIKKDERWESLVKSL